MQMQSRPPLREADDVLHIQGTDAVELFVGNAKQAAHFYRTAFGLSLIAYRGPENGSSDRVSYVLADGKVRLILTGALHPDHRIAAHVRQHGDGVHDIALCVDDAGRAFRETVRRGAVPVEEPATVEDEYGKLRRATIRIFGDTVHSFIERKEYRGVFAPGYAPVPGPDPLARSAGLSHFDHFVANVGPGEMNTWVRFYQTVMGFSRFQHFDDTDISTEYSALMSTVLVLGDGRVKVAVNEPASGSRKSQIEEYIDFYHGPGVQHIACATNDIVRTVRDLAARGVEFLRVPATYYRHLVARMGRIEEPLETLEKLGILADRDEEGYMLQSFSRPLQDRPTMFVEVIQRKGSRGFGKGNFKALFEAIEREQAARGNLS